MRLMPAQYVKPYVKTNKSDYIDAEAIAEAVQRPSMRFVPLKTEEQLDLQAVHRVRERWVMRRTAVINQIRGLLLERGITLPKGRSPLEERAAGNSCQGPHPVFWIHLCATGAAADRTRSMSTRIEEMDALIARTSKENDACRRLTSIPGVGPVTATALVAAIGNGSAFRKGRDLAAWVGLVPREYSTGGKQRLLRISKQGNSYLRRLFVQCPRSILRFCERQGAPFGAWLTQLTSRAPQNVVVVALANKLLRTAWAVLFKNEPYRSPMPTAA